MSLLGSLFGSRSRRSAGDSERTNAHDEALIRTDIGRLDKVRQGLGEQLVSYICRGENDSVLLTLGTLKKEAAEILRGRGWSSAGAWVSGRSDFLLAAQTWQPDTVRRYGEVLSPLYEGSRWPVLPGTERTPAWLRTVLLQYGESRAAIIGNTKWNKEPPARAKEPWSIDKLKSLLEADETPILDLAFERDEGW